ncbi:hypothetical protein [Oscillibacter sp.]|uniref:hypothetical protein n=1 Tax=Oscillibacter sp. TaxID=1945593 RepID=UPI00263723F1|nr:hypothetical protein [Oscillibacter sp.]MDD3347806.1 hypothetical protein [Oscillibacter sp.]
MSDFPKTKQIIGFTDAGQPLVLPDYSCGQFSPGQSRLLESKTCWYCRYADFRKTADVMLTQSICRCEQKRVHVIQGNKNEGLK